MDPAALAALAQKHAGEKRSHEQAAAAGAIAKPETLADINGNASVLNAANASVLKAVLGAGSFEAPLKSDADEQLIVSFTLPQIAKLSAITIAGPDDGSAPKEVLIFANKTSMDFDDCDSHKPTHTLTLGSAEATLPLPQTKFASVSSLTIFIKSNQGDEEETQLKHLQLVGVPVHTTNMNDLKKSG